MLTDALTEIFDDVMRIPESHRGLAVNDTCRLLAERVRSRFSRSEYSLRMKELESYYIDQFLHTASADPTFVERIRHGIALYL